ncbi:hypothetical protein [Blastococcus capsensis]|uniref:hypothetical protein n=1 Tax=Blastococcus capsensis TaxID=1564163 RepID=UPI00253F9D56|nr:hypothetical protein [Blastococcus capsensis]MDK3255803.1 hypothetical protein [Blastococcus capsensis]
MRPTRSVTRGGAVAALAPLVLATMAACSGGRSTTGAGIEERLTGRGDVASADLSYRDDIPGDPPSGLSRSIDLDEGDERKVLEEQHGPHPD